VLACVSEGMLLRLPQFDQPLPVGDAHNPVVVAGLQMAAKATVAHGGEREAEEAELGFEETLACCLTCSFPILAAAEPADAFAVLLAT
jgi:hypothetical protein